MITVENKGQFHTSIVIESVLVLNTFIITNILS